MQCEDIGVGVPRPLTELDSALNELGMLATSATNEYLSGLHDRKYLNMLTINTRYVSNVSIGFRMRPVVPHVRYKPYKLPKERHRTRSESNDLDSNSLVTEVVDDSDSALDDITQLKKAKSLESIIAESNTEVDFKNMNLGKPSEVEVVSKSIQNLRVVE